MRMSRKAPRMPPVVNQNRAAMHGDLAWRFPDRQFTEREVIPGPATCPRCHAYLETDHWQYDEHRHQQLEARPGTNITLCPGCTRVERRLYEGEVTIRHAWNAVSKEEAIHLIHNEEARARVKNPSARIALIEDRGDELYLLTTTQFLAERIGKELKKAYDGTLSVTPLPREKFSRVRWARE